MIHLTWYKSPWRLIVLYYNVKVITIRIKEGDGNQNSGNEGSSTEGSGDQSSNTDGNGTQDNT